MTDQVAEAASGRRARLAWFAASAVILLVGAVVASVTFELASNAGRIGADLQLYLEASRQFVAGHGFYPAHQLAGPYPVTDGDILYPPNSLVLFLPFLVLPAVLFWLIPLTVVAAVVVHHRPRPWTWPLLAVCLAYPITGVKIVHGNPVMWIAAAAALGTVFAWPSVVVLLKPTLAPFALIGAKRRSWWLALAVFAAIAVPFAGLWLDYVKVVLDARSRAGPLYSVEEVPFVLIPVIAWIGSPRFRMWRRTPATDRPAPAAEPIS